MANTLPSVTLSVGKGNEGQPKLSNIIGGFSGIGILPHTLYNIITVTSAVNVTVFGSGGVGIDVQGDVYIDSVVQHLFAGASAVQICTAFYKRGFGITPQLVDSLNAYMDDHGFASLDEMVGLSHQYEKFFEDGRLVGNMRKK